MKLTFNQLKKIIKEEFVKTGYIVKENEEPLSQEKYRNLKILVKQYGAALEDPDAEPTAEEVLKKIAELAGDSSAKFYSDAFIKHRE